MATSSFVVILFVLLINKSHQNEPKKAEESNDCGGTAENLTGPKSALVLRMKRLLSTGAFADVKILVGEGDDQETLLAHKGVLAMSSDYFDAMFSRWDNQQAPPKNPSKGKAKENSDDGLPVFEVPDVRIDAFRPLLKFIYADDLSGINAENAMEVRKAADEFNIKGLTEACDAILSVEPPSNPFVAYENAKFLNAKELVQKYLAHIDQNADALLKSNEFLQINQETLIEILERDQLVIKDELSIWEAALRWADEQCFHEGIDCAGDNRRQMLGQALYAIRFPLIPKGDFESIVSSDVLPIDDVIAVYQYHCRPQHSAGAVPTGIISGSTAAEGHQRYKLRFSTKNRHLATTITFKIGRISNFRLQNGTMLYSNTVQIKGVPWQIAAKNSDGINFGLFIRFTDVPNGPKLSFACRVTFVLISQKKGIENFEKSTEQPTLRADPDDWGYKHMASFEDLMNPEKGWYNRGEDSVTVAAKLNVGEPKTIE